MDMKKFINLEPMRYWSPDEGMGVEADIIDHPEKYSDYIASYKMDGEWAKMVWDGKDVFILSRSFSKKTGEYAHKEANVPHLVEVFKKLPANTCILGELCFDDLYKRSKDVGTLMRCLPEKAIARQEKEEDKLHFYVFDVLCYNGEDLINTPFEERITKYLGMVKQFCTNSPYIRFAEYKDIKTVAKHYEEYLSAGGEGFVLQRKDNVYYSGKRPAWKTIKLKKATQEMELPIVGLLNPEKFYTGKELANWEYFVDGIAVTKYYYKGWVAGIKVKNGDTICNVSSGITDEDAEWLSTYEARKLLDEGRLIAKVSAMEVEPDTGKLRHGRLLEIRTDI
jgi:ATP-dependent DNA ligase